jgi:predicted nucleotidyltransferase
MRERILERLAEIEHSEGVRVLYACESGSRAWGFPSADSDYDVRFLYLHPADWYLSIEDRRDVIERPVQELIDLSGWDLRKALRLFRKSNPPLLEWLGSPIVYVEQFTVADQLRRLKPVYYSRQACAYHYVHMARGNFRDYVKGDRMRFKKCFYVLRPILALNWIERDLGIVPTQFGELVNGLGLDPTLKAEIDRLLEVKHKGTELDWGPRIGPISDFIESELSRFERSTFGYDRHAGSAEQLDDLFRGALNEVWGDGV